MAAFGFPLSSTTQAYLDPGTGSLAVQMVIGAAVGALFTARVFWRRVTSFFKRTCFDRSRDGKTGN
ncbi:MAG: hypothetical protein HYX87_09310 [Chloroflexi bacterium]|nr:hypothetical protein [Chloroflexota bacterium]